MTSRARAALLVGYAAATFMSFPHPVGDRVIDWGLICGWLSPALLILGLRGCAPRSAAKLGFAAGLLAHGAILHWLYIVSVVYGQAPALMGLLGPLGMGAHAALFVAIFAAAFSWFASRGLASPWLAALLWTSLEALRALGSLGFPWATLGYSQHENIVLMGVVRYTGVYGLSFTLVLGGASLAEAVADWRSGRRPARRLWVCLAGVAAIAACGVLSIAGASTSGDSSVRVAVVQGNIDQGIKWDPEWAERTLVQYEELSRRAVAEGAQVVVFPESAVPGALNADANLRYRLAQLARETNATYVVGSVAVETEPGLPWRKFFDSAFVLSPEGRFEDRYDKSQLVPFGEFVPFRAWLGWLFQAVARGMATDGVTPGPGPRAVSLPVRRPGLDVVPAGVPICYELLFPDLTRRFVKDGAALLLAITNDAWYGRTGAPYQFLAMTAVRSAENGVWTARAANTGVSAIIDARGRVRSQTRIFESGLLVADIPLRPPPLGGTFYTRHGDLFVGACWMGVLGFGLVAGLRSVRATGDE